MDVMDPDATPRVLRVIKGSSNQIERDYWQKSWEKGRRFSLRSISGSLSSIWSRDSTSRSHGDFSQDQAAHGCGSFATLLTPHHARSQSTRQGLHVRAENTPLPAPRCVSVSKRPYTPNPRQPTIQKKQRKPPPIPHRRVEASRANFDLVKQLRPKVMASNSGSMTSSSGDDESAHGGPVGNNGNAVRRGSVGVERVASNGANGTHGFPNGEYVNSVLRSLSAGQHAVSSGRTSRNSVDTAATSFDENLASRVAPIAYHPARSPNPLRAPQPSLESVRSHRGRQPSLSEEEEETPLPAVAALKVDAFTTTSFGQNAKFGATAHAIFNVTAVPQNASMADESDANSDVPLPPYRLMDNYPGYLSDLQFQTCISGPGLKLVEMGPPTRESLHLGDSWVMVVHLGVKETSLASRLSISVRSKGNKTLIDQWLDVLKMDNRKKNESVVVTAIIKYRHAFMPADTWLETRASCTPDISGENHATAAAKKAWNSKAKAKAPHLAEPSPYMVLKGDPLQRTLLAGMLVRLLDPRHDDLKLHSLRGAAGPNQPSIRAVDALRLLQEVRECFGYGQDYYVNLDLVALREYYENTVAKESRGTEGTAIARSVRRHAQTMVKKLSPQKLAKKPVAVPVPAPSPEPMTPHIARNIPRVNVAGPIPGIGIGRSVVREPTIYEEGEAFYAQIIEGRPGTPRPAAM